MSVAVPVDVAQIEREALVRRAQERLSRLEDIRAAHRLSEAGQSQRQIAEALHTTQPRVHRMLRVAYAYEVHSPEEIILRATVNRVDRRKLVRELSQCDYSFRRHAPEPFEGAQPGTWDQVTAALFSGMLSKDEFEQVRAAVKPPTS